MSATAEGQKRIQTLPRIGQRPFCEVALTFSAMWLERGTEAAVLGGRKFVFREEMFVHIYIRAEC